jgi:glutamate N-acetyltransferase/amino-acid N-acetyltransferase
VKFMKNDFKSINNAGVTFPAGFKGGAVSAGIKGHNDLDLAIIYSEKPCAAAAVYTTNSIQAAPIITNKDNLSNKRAQAIIVNSGCANACTGKDGLDDALEMTRLAADKLNIASRDVIVASTGIIGVPLPMSMLREGVSRLQLRRNSGKDVAKAITTTDTYIKHVAIPVKARSGAYVISGIAKGAGMIHPDMATMLCFLTTDAAVEPDFLQLCLKDAVDNSFNMITVDGDTSPNDMVVILANGISGNRVIDSRNGATFKKALNRVCSYLAKCIAGDGEGATKLIEVIVENAASQQDARSTARCIASSILVKTAINGNDPNWGRIVSAAGRSGALVVEHKLDLYINNYTIMQQGYPVPFSRNELSRNMAKNKEVYIRIKLNQGDSNAVAWGCDLSKEYVIINSAYTT